MPSKPERTLLIFERLISGQPAPTHADLVREMGIQRGTLSDALGEVRDLEPAVRWRPNHPRVPARCPR